MRRTMGIIVTVALVVVASMVALGGGLRPTGVEAQATPTATGPIRIVSPTEGETVAGPNVAIAWEAPGLTIVPAAEAQAETDYHVHFIVDNVVQVTEGVPLPRQECVIHTAANPATITLTPGEHTVQLVIGNPGHVPVAGLDRPTVTFTVSTEDASPEASPMASPAAVGSCVAPASPMASPTGGMAGTPEA